MGKCPRLMLLKSHLLLDLEYGSSASVILYPRVCRGHLAASSLVTAGRSCIILFLTWNCSTIKWLQRSCFQPLHLDCLLANSGYSPVHDTSVLEEFTIFHITHLSILSIHRGTSNLAFLTMMLSSPKRMTPDRSGFRSASNAEARRPSSSSRSSCDMYDSRSRRMHPSTQFLSSRWKPESRLNTLAG